MPLALPQRMKEEATDTRFCLPRMTLRHQGRRLQALSPTVLWPHLSLSLPHKRTLPKRSDRKQQIQNQSRERNLPHLKVKPLLPRVRPHLAPTQTLFSSPKPSLPRNPPRPSMIITTRPSPLPAPLLGPFFQAQTNYPHFPPIRPTPCYSKP